MGIGGYLSLINITPWTMIRGDQSSYQMNSWDFPQTLKPFSQTEVYIEREYLPFGTVSDTQAGVTYMLAADDLQTSADSLSYQIHYTAPDGHEDGAVEVILSNLQTPETAKGGAINLGFSANAVASDHITTPWILSGLLFEFSANDISSAWMSRDLGTLGCRILRHICLPGSHDAGMSRRDGGTVFGTEGRTRTQHLDIGQQLAQGIRYFDLRPVISDGQYKTGHYSHISGSFQGANGQSFDEIINQVNDYTDKHSELVILYLSGTYNTDLGPDSYRAFNQDEWDGLLSQLAQGLHHLSSAPSLFPGTDIGWLRLDTFISATSAAVIVVVDDKDIDLGSREGHGFISSTRFSLVNEYSNTNDKDKMADDQFDKLNRYRGGSIDGDSGFLMSWTLTLSTSDTIGGTSVLTLADWANNALYSAGYFWDRYVKTPLVFPNVLMIDDVPDDGRFRALVFGINWMLGWSGIPSAC
ncbi:PLC-like phosphodiesterase [Immersiella caudata]|uniref:PLC-like phosphodiesterase n=1 Tax=Immersiella caudata TaxID=314043 RepID=A0AA40BX66_9PEZI|nr:PLC-like phosphodiesterase [Immersiella caudata]